MAMRNILVLVAGDAGASAVEAAFLLIDGRGGHVTGMHATGDALANMPLVVENMGGQAMALEYDRAKERIEEAKQQSEALFRDACAGRGIPVDGQSDAGGGVTAAWVSVEGRASDAMAERGRIYDVLVSGVDGMVGAELTLEVVENLAFETGRPVLAVPESLPPTIGRRIYLAWNKSAQAARAVAVAAPMLEAAESVIVGHVDTGAKSGPGADELAACLVRNGVRAEVRTSAADDGSVAETLNREAQAVGADMIVMGAYSRGRLRELVLGGVTRDILRNLTLPVMLIH